MRTYYTIVTSILPKSSQSFLVNLNAFANFFRRSQIICLTQKTQYLLNKANYLKFEAVLHKKKWNILNQLFSIYNDIIIQKDLAYVYYKKYPIMNRLSQLSSQVVAKEQKPFKNKTLVITGGSRGIGLAIAKACAKDGANIAILAKTTVQNPKLPGTIYTAAKEIQQLGGKALALQCDIRDQKTVAQCIKKVVQTFGGIDILVNNASAISLTPTLETSMKKYDLMHQINIRGTFLMSKTCLPHLLKSSNPHILNLSPPLNMQARWFAPHVAYSMAKYGMSMCVLGMAEQFRDQGVAVNALWPRTAIATAAVKNLLGGDQAIGKSRIDAIMGDAAYEILRLDSKTNTGNYYIDDQVLRKSGVKCLKKYQVDPSVKEEDLLPDFFV